MDVDLPDGGGGGGYCRGGGALVWHRMLSTRSLLRDGPWATSHEPLSWAGLGLAGLDWADAEQERHYSSPPQLQN